MIIGLCGKAGAGKNFIADILEKKYGYKTISFADPIKRICEHVFDFSPNQLWGPSHMRNEPDKRWPRICEFCEGSGKILDFAEGNRAGWETCDVCNGAGKTYLTPRECLQKCGTEFGRSCYENIWVDYAIRDAKQILNEKIAGVIISDVRFQNEMTGIKDAGGKVVRVVRKTTTLDGQRSMHQSETEQDKIPDSNFDFILHNVDDLDTLNYYIENMIVVLEG